MTGQPRNQGIGEGYAEMLNGLARYSADAHNTAHAFRESLFMALDYALNNEARDGVIEADVEGVGQLIDNNTGSVTNWYVEGMTTELTSVWRGESDTELWASFTGYNYPESFIKARLLPPDVEVTFIPDVEQPQVD